MKRRATAAALALALTAPAASGQQTDSFMAEPPAVPDAPPEAVDDRQAAMMLMWYAAETIGNMLREGPVDQRRARSAAKTLDEVSAKVLSYFPEGTAAGVGDSNAMADIWREWDTMQAHARQLQQGVQALRSAVESEADPAEIIPAFRQMGYACGSCHYDFRYGQDLLAAD